MHADDGGPHDQGGEGLAKEGAGCAVAQAKRNPERGAGGEHGNQDGEDEEPAVVVNTRLYLHGRHADVVHGGDACPHQQGAPRDLAPG
ncbi:hypothetical protein D3C87_1357650 [compost metagenome]